MLIIERYFVDVADENKRKFLPQAAMVISDDVAASIALALSLKTGWENDEIYVYEDSNKEVKHKFKAGVQEF